MRKKVANWSIVFVSFLGCCTIVSNFPRSIDVIKLENGLKITIEVNENIMAMRDPMVTKTITIDYGKRKLTHKCSYDDYDYRICLLKGKSDTIWVLQEADGYQTAKCSFNDTDAKFVKQHTSMKNDKPKDTLLKINYTDFVFEVKSR